MATGCHHLTASQTQMQIPRLNSPRLPIGTASHLNCHSAPQFKSVRIISTHVTAYQAKECEQSQQKLRPHCCIAITAKYRHNRKSAIPRLSVCLHDHQQRDSSRQSTIICGALRQRGVISGCTIRNKHASMTEVW